jgi:ATP synthase protein I
MARLPRRGMQMGKAAEAAWEAVIALGLGMLLGYYLDRWLGTHPWLFFTLLGLGLITGFQRLWALTRSAKPGDGPGGAPR